MQLKYYFSSCVVTNLTSHIEGRTWIVDFREQGGEEIVWV
jgi:hypothetical protein